MCSFISTQLHVSVNVLNRSIGVQTETYNITYTSGFKKF